MQETQIINVYITRKLTEDDPPTSTKQLYFLKSLCAKKGNDFPFTIKEAKMYLGHVTTYRTIKHLEMGYRVVFIVQESSKFES